MSTASILKQLTESYAAKNRKDSQVCVNFQIDEEMWHVIAKESEEPILNNGEHPEPDFVVVVSEEVLNQLASGDISPLTAAGRESLHQSAPLDFRLPDGVAFSMELYHRVIRFVQRFFNAMPGECVKMDEGRSRLVHGGHVIGLFADAGFRSGWYQVQPGERLNNPGDTNPFPQAFVVLSGGGTVQIGDKMMDVEPGCAYYIGPDTEHMIEPAVDQPVTLIWMAWGDGA